ncbi:MAG: ROK family protein [Candidatus Aenigmatarchaeota archaeon]
MYLLLDIGATNLRIAIASKNKIKSKYVIKNPGNEIEIVKFVESFIKKFDKIEKIGIASVGPLDYKKGIILNPANLPIGNFKIVEIFEKKFNIDTYLINDCNAAVLAEKYFGSGKKFQNLVYVTFSTGIGGGAIVDGNLLLGKDGNAVEIGHIVIDFEERLKCGCGSYGHWEAYCSGKNIPNFIKNYLGLNLNYSAEQLFNLAKNKDKKASEIVEKIGELNAIGIANVINCFDPEFISIGGSIALNNKELIIKPIKEKVKNYTINRVPQITVTKLGDEICLFGVLVYLSLHT